MILKRKEKKMGMIFNEKFAESVKRLKEIGKPDCPKNQLNKYADFVELVVLLLGKDGVSYGDIQDSFFGEPDVDTDAEKKDTEEFFIRSIFSLIDERAILFGDFYPFEKKNNTLFLSSSMTNDKKYYILFLLSSSLNIFQLFMSDLTTDFETLSLEVLKKYLPTAIVKPFGKNSVYKGTAPQKITALSCDIGLPLDNYEINQIGERNNQERGLDVVGWLSFDDNCQNKVVFLGQCACGKDFESKQHDTRRFEDYLRFYKTRPQHTLFIPYSLINVKEGKFYGNYIEKDYLVFERKRMVTLLNGNQIYNQLLSKNLVETCLCYSCSCDI